MVTRESLNNEAIERGLITGQGSAFNNLTPIDGSVATEPGLECSRDY
jgi:hypothetical protein